MILHLPQGVQRGFRSSGASSVFESPESAAYWTYHVGRMSFFTLQGIAGALLPHVVIHIVDGAFCRVARC